MIPEQVLQHAPLAVCYSQILNVVENLFTFFVFLYIFSPIKAGYGLNDCEKFCLESNTWKSISPTSKSRCKFGVGTNISGHILLFGGQISVFYFMLKKIE